MAQPTVTARPATWAGTSNPILYKFTSTNYALAGYRMEVELWNSITGLKIADAVYSANSAGLLLVDVSALLKANMSLDNNSALTSAYAFQLPATFSDGNWIKYYIKYQEKWTASSETKVDDVANLRYAIYGGLQIGSINDFTDYIPSALAKKFLRLAGSGLLNRPFTISCIGAANMAVSVERYLNLVVIEKRAWELIDAAVNRINLVETFAERLDVQVIGNTVSAWTNGFIPTPASFQFDSVTTGLASSTGATAATIDIFHKAYSGGALNVPIFVVVRVTSSNLGGLVTLSMTAYNAAKTSSFASATIPVTYNGIYFLQASSVSIVPAFIQIEMTNGTAGAVNWTVQVLDEPKSEKISILMDEVCDNSIMLQWRNSLGGDECYPFNTAQEYTFTYGNGRKAKRLTLIADGLTLSQWEAIQGLNTLGELYKVNIVEMLTSTNRSHATIGQSVYILNSNGSKVGVNVIGTANTTNTRRKKHAATVTIEYPELILQ